MSQERITDPLGNQYIIINEEIQKLNNNGDVLYRYSNPLYGELSWFDLSDPFRLLIYYSELNQIIFLNNKLSPIGEAVYLDKLKLLNPAGIANSKNGSIWILDRSTQSLILLGQRLTREIQIQVKIFNNIPLDNWFHMQEWKQNLYILSPGKTLYKFDLYGQLINKIPVSANSLRSSSKGLMLNFSDHKSIFVPETNEIIPLK